MVAAIPASYVAKGTALWIMTMLPTLLTLVTRDFTVNIILLVVAFPIMLSYLSKMAIFASIKTSVIAVAAAATFFILYTVSKLVPRVQEGMQNPGENRKTTLMIIALITTVFAASMAGAAYVIPMYPIVANTAANQMVNNIS